MALYFLSATIPAGQSLSEGVACNGRILRIVMPPAWSPGQLSFLLSSDGVEDYCPLYNIQTTAGVYTPFEATVAVIPGVVYAMPIETGNEVAFLKFRSGTKLAPVPQAADRKFTIVVGPPA